MRRRAGLRVRLDTHRKGLRVRLCMSRGQPIAYAGWLLLRLFSKEGCSCYTQEQLCIRLLLRLFTGAALTEALESIHEGRSHRKYLDSAHWKNRWKRRRPTLLFLRLAIHFPAASNRFGGSGLRSAAGKKWRPACSLAAPGPAT